MSTILMFSVEIKTLWYQVTFEVNFFLIQFDPFIWIKKNRIQFSLYGVQKESYVTKPK